MSYLIEVETPAGQSGYLLAQGISQEQALERVREQLSVAEAEEVVVLAVHTVH